MALPSRRFVLAVLVCASVLFAGCSSPAGGGGDAGVELGAVTVENSDGSAHTVHVLVERDSDPRYGTAVTLDGISPPTNASDFGSIDSTTLTDPAWTASANWTVYTRVDAKTSWQAHTVPSNADGDCTAVRLKIETDGSITSFTPDCASWPPTPGG